MIDDLRIHAARESRPRTDGELVLSLKAEKKKFDVAKYVRRHSATEV